MITQIHKVILGKKDKNRIIYMKNLVDMLNESLNESRKDTIFPTDGEHGITLTDIRGDFIEFDPHIVEKIYKKNKSYYENKNFIRDLFDEFPDADMIWYERINDDDDNTPLKSIQRDEQDKGWQDEK